MRQVKDDGGESGGPSQTPSCKERPAERGETALFGWKTLSLRRSRERHRRHRLPNWSAWDKLAADFSLRTGGERYRARGRRIEKEHSDQAASAEASKERRLGHTPKRNTRVLRPRNPKA